MFNERLEKCRSTLNLNKRQMAEKIEISEGYYSLIESGKRTPSKMVIEKLITLSGLSEEYWIYGINQEEYINTKDDFKSLRKTLNMILELNVINNTEDLFDENNDPVDSLGKLLINALKKDINEMMKS